MKKSILAIVLTIFCLNAGAQDYYINDGGVMATPAYGDPKSVNPVEWQIWLYNLGSSKGGKSLRWGTLSGKSVDSVMSQLKAGQAIELRYNKFFGTSSGLCTYFNPLGPIAIQKKADFSQSQDHQDALDKLSGLVSKVSDLYDTYGQIKDMTSGDESSASGEGFKEFAKNLKEALERAAKLHDMLETTMDVLLPSLNDQFDEITKNIEVSQQLGTSLNSAPAANLQDVMNRIIRLTEAERRSEHIGDGSVSDFKTTMTCEVGAVRATMETIVSADGEILSTNLDTYIIQLGDCERPSAKKYGEKGNEWDVCMFCRKGFVIHHAFNCDGWEDGPDTMENAVLFKFSSEEAAKAVADDWRRAIAIANSPRHPLPSTAGSVTNLAVPPVKSGNDEGGASSAGDAKEQLRLGLLYENAGDGVKAMNYFRADADQGNAAAQLRMGLLYANMEDKAIAIDYFHAAADQGNGDAQLQLGYVYSRGVEMDESTAIKWFVKAAGQGNVAAENELKSFVEERAFRSEDLSALNSVAWLYATSSNPGVRDGFTAVLLAEKAVEATLRKEPAYLDTLGAAYAETGQFDKAVAVEKESIQLQTDEKIKGDYNERLELYKVNKSYRSP